MASGARPGRRTHLAAPGGDGGGRDAEGTRAGGGWGGRVAGGARAGRGGVRWLTWVWMTAVGGRKVSGRPVRTPSHASLGRSTPCTERFSCAVRPRVPRGRHPGGSFGWPVCRRWRMVGTRSVSRSFVGPVVGRPSVSVTRRADAPGAGNGESMRSGRSPLLLLLLLLPLLPQLPLLLPLEPSMPSASAAPARRRLAAGAHCVPEESALRRAGGRHPPETSLTGLCGKRRPAYRWASEPGRT